MFLKKLAVIEQIETKVHDAGCIPKESPEADSPGALLLL